MQCDVNDSEEAEIRRLEVGGIFANPDGADFSMPNVVDLDDEMKQFVEMPKPLMPGYVRK